MCIEQKIRYYNGCSEYRIKMEVARNTSFLMKSVFINYGYIEPGAYKDVEYYRIAPDVLNYFVCAKFHVEGVRCSFLTQTEFENCREIKFYVDNGRIIIKIISGNCFDRMR